MICQRCQAENESGAKFCANCGGAMEEDAGKEAAYCSSCGAVNAAGSAFCESCGAQMGQATAASAPAPKATISQPAAKTSGAWWLMPIFLTWVGGLIAFLVLKDTDKSKALKLLWAGIGMTVFWIVLGIVSMIISFVTNMNSFY